MIIFSSSSIFLVLLYEGFTLPVYSSFTKKTFVKIENVNKKDLFNTMSDIRNYPKILPGSYISVKIINQTSDTVYAEEEVSERGVTTKLIVKHMMTPYEKHVLEVVDGDARGTKITVTLDEINTSSTSLTVDVELHLHGILVIFKGLAEAELEHAINTVITHFVEYTKNQINT